MRNGHCEFALGHVDAACAQTMERLHAIISWSDPYATGMFVAGCLFVALIIAVLSWPLVQATAVCFLVSAALKV